MKKFTPAAIWMAMIIVCFVLFSGCTQFKDGGGWVFGDGLFIIPLIGFIGGGLLIRDAIRQSKGTYLQQTPQGQVEVPPVSIWKNPRLYIGAAILIFIIIMIIDTISNR